MPSRCRRLAARIKFLVNPLRLGNTPLGTFEPYFDEQPLWVPISNDAGGIEPASHPILIALGKRLPADLTPRPKPRTEPPEESSPTSVLRT